MPHVIPQIQYPAALACLNIYPEESSSLQSALSEVVTCFDKVKSVVDSQDEAVVSSQPSVQRLRDDRVQTSLTAEQALQNAPQSERGFILVPKVLG